MYFCITFIVNQGGDSETNAHGKETSLNGIYLCASEGSETCWKDHMRRELGKAATDVLSAAINFLHFIAMD